MQRWMAILSVLALSGCTQTIDANKKVKESNASMDEANKLEREGMEAQAQAGTKYRTDVDTATAAAQTCVKKLDEAQAKVDVASKLLKEASEMTLAKEYSEYLSLMSKADGKI